MIGYIIVLIMFMWILTLLGGILLGKLFWTPPIKSVK